MLEIKVCPKSGGEPLKFKDIVKIVFINNDTFGSGIALEGVELGEAILYINPASITAIEIEK